MLLSRNTRLRPCGDHRTGDDKPQQVGNFQLVEQQGSGEDDDQNQQEFENRILEREGYAGE